jgi:hypothetical protein
MGAAFCSDKIRRMKMRRTPTPEFQAAVRQVHIEEMSLDARVKLEKDIDAFVESVTPVRKLLGEQVVNRLVSKLEASGFTDTAARHMVELQSIVWQYIRHTQCKFDVEAFEKKLVADVATRPIDK